MINPFSSRVNNLGEAFFNDASTNEVSTIVCQRKVLAGDKGNTSKYSLITHYFILIISDLSLVDRSFLSAIKQDNRCQKYSKAFHHGIVILPLSVISPNHILVLP